MQRGSSVPDDLSGFERQFRARLANHFHRDDLEKRNPYRPEPSVREQQKRWLVHRDPLWDIRDRVEMLWLGMLAFSIGTMAAGFFVWANYGKVAALVFLPASIGGFIGHKLRKWSSELTRHIEGHDRLVRFPLLCDECDEEFILPKTCRNGTCEICPNCHAPLDPPSRAEQCYDCKMLRAS